MTDPQKDDAIEYGIGCLRTFDVYDMTVNLAGVLTS
jgi:hypothetical protein